MFAQVRRAVASFRKWIADFTHVWTAEGWLYVAALVDLFSRRLLDLGQCGDGGLLLVTEDRAMQGVPITRRSDF
jgi:putative transposase